MIIKNEMGMRSLLIVEDEEMLRETLLLNLEDLGVNIETAKNGQEGLSFLKNQSFDAVLCDIKMPEMTGLELLEEVQKLSIPSPFVFLTAFGEKEYILQALRLGATDFLFKPFETHELISVTRRAMEIGVRRNAILQMRDMPGKQKEIRRAENMVNLFRLANNSKRRA